jgi:biotin transport system substrate-specific component
MPVKLLQQMVYASLFAALTAVGAYIYIPIGPVPIVLQNLFVLLAGLLLGSRWGFTSIGIYLLVGAIGIPVFAGGKGGIAHFLGPTGGYLIGFAISALITGFIAERSNGRTATDILAVVIGSLVTYAFGAPWLKVVTGMTWAKALMVGMVPFLPGDALKASAAVVLARSIRPMMKQRWEAGPL